MFQVSHIMWFLIVIGVAFILNWMLSTSSEKNTLSKKIQKDTRLKKEVVPVAVVPAQQQQVPSQMVVKKEQTELPRYVFLEVSKEDYMRPTNAGKIVIELYTDVVPKTCLNFIELCRTKRYMNSPFHRVIKDFMIQGGDFINGNGTGSYSIYGSNFKDENFKIHHTESGLLSMANSGPDTNGCQFFILTQPAPHLDNKHVVFGKVVSGMEHVTELENEVTDGQDKPVRKWFISDCGILPETESNTSVPSSKNVRLVMESQNPNYNHSLSQHSDSNSDLNPLLTNELEQWKRQNPMQASLQDSEPQPFYGF